MGSCLSTVVEDAPSEISAFITAVEDLKSLLAEIQADIKAIKAATTTTTPPTVA